METPWVLLVAGTAILFVVVIILMLKDSAGRRTARRQRDRAWPEFYARPVLNQSEIQLFWVLLKALNVNETKRQLLAQVNYGEFLACEAKKKYFMINAKRADFVICDFRFNVQAVVEYHGKGHFGDTATSRSKIEKRDREKRVSLAEAEIPLVVIPAEFDDALVAERLAAVLPAASKRP